MRPTLLVLRHHGLGDLMTAQPVLRGLRRRFPEHRLVVTCPSWLVPLARFLRCGDELVLEPRGACAPCDPSDHRRIDPALLSNVAQQAGNVDVLVSLRTPGPELLEVIAASRPRVLVSYRHAAISASAGYPELDFSDHIVERWRRLLAPLGVEVRESDLYCDAAASDEAGHTIVHIGAGSQSRLWPVQRWAEVVRHLERAGHRVVLTGSAAEAPRVDEVRAASGLPRERDRAGATGIMALACLVAGARAVACADSGVSHLATAFRRPAVTLFGPVPPAWWGPPPGSQLHTTIWTGRSGDNYADRADPGLLEISVEHVCRAMDELSLDAP